MTESIREQKQSEKPATPKTFPRDRARAILACLVGSDGPEAAKVAAQVRPEHFDGQEYRDIASVALRYRDKYGRPPGAAHLSGLLPDVNSEGAQRRRDMLVLELTALGPDVNPQHILDLIHEQAREAELKAAVLEANDRFVLGRAEGLNDDIEVIFRKALDAAPAPHAVPVCAMDIARFNLQPAAAPEVLVHPWLRAGDRWWLHGREGTLKTLLALHLAHCGADCMPCLDGRWLPTRPLRVLFVDGELSLTQMIDRTRRFPVRRRRNFHVLSKMGADAAGAPVPSFFTPQGRTRIDREVEAVRPDLVILDSVFTLGGALSERELEKWSELDPWLKGYKARGIAVIIIDHEPKASRTIYGSVLKGVLSDGYLGLEEVRGASDDPEEKVLDAAFGKTRAFGGSAARPFRIVFHAGPAGAYCWRTEEKPSAERSARAEALSEQVRALKAEKLSNAEIARRTGVSAMHVGRLLKKAQGAM